MAQRSSIKTSTVISARRAVVLPAAAKAPMRERETAATNCTSCNFINDGADPRGANREVETSSALIKGEINRALYDARAGRERGRKPLVITELEREQYDARYRAGLFSRDMIVIKCLMRLVDGNMR